ncbi:MAG: hypothetical protein R3C53_14630 [Pirellulaceae bacterium]
MNPMHIDDQILDELVTGNLRGEQYRQVLLALEARPHLWRRCAIAFLQEQALAQDLKSLTQTDLNWAERRALVGHGAPFHDLPALVSRSAPQGNWFTSKAVLSRFATLAALLLVSFCVGWLGAGLQRRDPPSVNDPVHQASIMPRMAQPTNSHAITQPNSLAQPSRNPTMEQFAASQQFMPIDLSVPTALRELEREGRIRIETFDGIMPITLDDGTSAIVPVQQFRVVPVMISY